MALRRRDDCKKSLTGIIRTILLRLISLRRPMDRLRTERVNALKEIQA